MGIHHWLGIFALSGLMSVAMGAFGTHGLKGEISEPLLAAFQTATWYQMFHTLAGLMLVMFLFQLVNAPKILWYTLYCWLAGILLFSGSLYALAMGAPSWLGPVTPVGGVLLMAGWLFLAVGAFRFH